MRSPSRCSDTPADLLWRGASLDIRLSSVFNAYTVPRKIVSVIQSFFASWLTIDPEELLFSFALPIAITFSVKRADYVT